MLNVNDFHISHTNLKVYNIIGSGDRHIIKNSIEILLNNKKKL